MDKLQEIKQDKHELQKSINKLITEFANKYNDVLLDVDVRLTSTKGSTGKTAIVGESQGEEIMINKSSVIIGKIDNERILTANQEYIFLPKTINQKSN